MKLLSFDLGLEHTAHVILEARIGVYVKHITPRDLTLGPQSVSMDGARQIELINHGTITTSRDDTVDDRIDQLYALIGAVVWGAKEKGVEAIVSEEAPLGSSSGGWSQRSGALTFGVRCLVTAAARFAGYKATFYPARTWQSAVGVLRPPMRLPAKERRRYVKSSISARVASYVEGAHLLKNEHEIDAAGVGVCHLLRGVANG